MAITFDDLQANRFQEDLRQAAGFKPLTSEDLNNAYQRYESVGVKRGRVKGKSDAQLYKQATDDVLNWWKKQKAEEAERRAALQRQQAEAAAAQARAQEEARRAAAAATQRAAMTSGGGFSGLPDTAAGGDAPTAQQVNLLARPTPQYIQQAFERFNLWGAKPPAYALVSVGAFDQWVRSATKWLEEQRRRQAVAIRTSSGTQVVSSATGTNRAPVIR